MTRQVWYYLLGIGLVSKIIITLIQRKKATRGQTSHWMKISRGNSAKAECLSISEVLFFPDKEYPCPTIIELMTLNPLMPKTCYNPSCRRMHGEESSMIKFLNYLSQAKTSIDLCIYMFTQPTMAAIIRYLKSTGVRIRIITDASESNIGGDQLSRLSSDKIDIKSNHPGTGALMHHKFVIVDNRILLTGSFNWTNKAVVNNFEAVIVTTDPKLVNPFISKFEELWVRFDKHIPYNDKHPMTNVRYL